MKLIKLITLILAVLIATAAVSAASVVITPNAPEDTDALTCKVSGSSAIYNFYWYKDGAYNSKKTGTSSTISSSATKQGETWTCKAFVPSSAYLPEMYIGEASTFITLDLPAAVHPACNDWIDNDGDGLVDMLDPGCDFWFDDNEYNYVEPDNACENGLDDDADGLVDMADPGCTNPDDNDEYNAPVTETQCNDGLDNDADTLVDLADPGCASKQDSDENNCGNFIYRCKTNVGN